MSPQEMYAWLSKHELVMIYFLVPLFSGIVAYLSSRYSTRVALKQDAVRRKYEGTKVLSGYRQDWMNSLREDIAEHQSICLASKIVKRTSNIPDDKHYRLSELSNRILLRLDPEDPNYQGLSNALAIERQRFLGEDIPSPETVKLSQMILERSWARLKRDLEGELTSMKNEI